MRLLLAVLFIGWTATLASAQTTKGKTPSKEPIPTYPGKIAGKSFEEWVKEIASKDPSKSEMAFSALRAFPPAISIKAIPNLLNELRKPPPIDLSVRCNVCVVLADLLASGEPIEPKWKAESVRMLTPLLRDPQAILRFRAVVALGSAGPDARAAIGEIHFMLRDNATWEAREAAATALGLIAHDPTNGPSLEVLKHLYGLLNDRAYKVRMAAVHSLSLLGPSDATNKELVDNYVAALLPVATKDPEPGLQIWARVAIIGATKDFKAANIDPIAKHATSSDPVVRVQAVQAIGTLGTHAKANVPILINCLGDPDLSVQSSAIWALGRMETAAFNAVPILQKMIDDPTVPEFIKRSAKETADKIKGK